MVLVFLYLRIDLLAALKIVQAVREAGKYQERQARFPCRSGTSKKLTNNTSTKGCVETKLEVGEMLQIYYVTAEVLVQFIVPKYFLHKIYHDSRRKLGSYPLRCYWPLQSNHNHA